MKKGYRTAAIICAILFIIFVVLCFPKKNIGPSNKDDFLSNEGNNQTGDTAQQDAPYKSPVDFEKLQKMNPDICGWLTIPGTDISYPIAQSQTDDTFYLNHGEDKKYNINGALFTEHIYNKNDFSDPVTAVYGHHQRSGEMFGNLQKYYTDDFEKYSELVVYTPEEEIRYQVFAAVSFSNRHILYYYDCFKDKVMMKEFLDDINAVRAIGSYVDKSADVSEEDRLLVLSTCLQGDRTCRFLVVGKRID